MKRITIELDYGPSLEELGVTHIKTDHVRLGQIVTNLTANAIRFTANSPIRKITVRFDAARRPPIEGSCAVPTPNDIAPFGLEAQNGHTAQGKLQDEETMWLFVSVIDTGPGLTAHERQILFQRFTRE
jgi:signal transduction histidine kinase